MSRRSDANSARQRVRADDVRIVSSELSLAVPVIAVGIVRKRGRKRQQRQTKQQRAANHNPNRGAMRSRMLQRIKANNANYAGREPCTDCPNDMRFKIAKMV